MPLTLRWIHVMGAVTWIGGMLFIALVLVPLTRGLDPTLRTRLVQEAGRRFRTVGWIALGLSLATGLATVWVEPQLLAVPRFQAKLALVVIALALGALHDFVLGPRASQPDAHPSARARASWLARLNVPIALAIVLLGLSLRG